MNKPDSETSDSTVTAPESIGILAGGGAYPRLVIEGARSAGVKDITLFAFRGQTTSHRNCADNIHWLNIGRYRYNLGFIASHAPECIVMAGQISPATLFRARFDKDALRMLKSLTFRNADTIYGAIIDALKEKGITTLPASAFMARHIPAPGILTKRSPSKREEADIELGMHVASETSRLTIGQTVAIKNGTVIAVEAFEGTNATIKRAGRVGRKGCVMVKVASERHDMRVDIPCIGLKTLSRLKRAGFTCLAIQAYRTLLLEMPRVIAMADKLGIAITSVDSKLPHAPTIQQGCAK